MLSEMMHSSFAPMQNPHFLTVTIPVEDLHIESVELKLLWKKLRESYSVRGEAIFHFVNGLLNDEKCSFGCSFSTCRPRNIYIGRVTYYNASYLEGLICYFNCDIGIGRTGQVYFPETQMVRVRYPTVLKHPTVQQTENQEILVNYARLLMQKVVAHLFTSGTPQPCWS